MGKDAFNPFKPRDWQLAHGRHITLGPKGILMGILNVTPDSFSDGGKLRNVDVAVFAALQMVEEGAAIVDVGGESTKPGAVPISAEEEQARILPVIEALSEKTDAFISIDTYRAETAKMAIEAGAHIINDVWGFQKEQAIAKVASDTGAGCCLMHSGRERDRDRDVIKDQIDYLSKSLEIAKSAGVKDEAIVLDPGFGFAKEPEENVELLANFERLFELGFPLLTGTSRKRFLGAVTGREVGERDVATAATSVLTRMKGSTVFRVHDIGANKDALAIADAVIAAC
ncbi:MAG: dihydropteroate synthase [Hyphomicrobiales bacterium]|nr:MAG: dihydropteroate synthase [Hyphomicrobiales bacterium]